MNLYSSKFLIFFISLSLLLIFISHYAPKMYRSFLKMLRPYQLPSMGMVENLTDLIFMQQGETSFMASQSQHIRFVEYKFYGDLIHLLIANQRQYGIPITPILKSLRQQLQKDLKLENNFLLRKRQAVIQFFGIAIVTWLLMLSTLENIPEHKLLLMGILGWQILGILFFSLSLKSKHRQLFFLFPGSLKTLLHYWIVSHLEMPQKVKIEIAQVETWGQLVVTHGSKTQGHPFLSFKYFFDKCLKKEREMGISILEECELVINELWNRWEMDLDIFFHFLMQLKMVISIVFFLSSFLVVIYYQSTLMMQT
ncbi:MAG: hypothetical protein QE271_08425 [Bacteriovoracaceae bacterium]|nr:hypothetical protein [Bacteriovoracaceae bacterium]